MEGRKRGRPKKLEKQIPVATIRLERDDLETLREMAADVDMTVYGYLKNKVLDMIEDYRVHRDEIDDRYYGNSYYIPDEDNDRNNLFFNY